MAVAATYSYDGNQPGTVVATITGATVGNQYYLFVRPFSGTSAYTGPVIASSSSLTITCTTVGTGWTVGDTILVFCEDDGPTSSDYSPFSPTLLKIGTASGGQSNPAGMAATWNPSTGATTITLTTTYGTDTDPFSWYDGGDGDDPTGALTTLNLTMGMSGLSPTNPRDLLVIEVFKPSPSRYIDVGVWLAIPGDSTLHAFAGVLNAAFSESPTSGVAPLSVTFTDLSTPGPGGAITGWAWDFGDGGTSTSQNPTHTYTTAGTFTITLVVTSPDGTSTATHTELVIVAGTNVDIFHALTLTGCSTVTWNTASYPLHPPGTDYPNSNGWTIVHQAWFKITNHSSQPRYARIAVQNVTSPSNTMDIEYIMYALVGGTPVYIDNNWSWMISGYQQAPFDSSDVYNTEVSGGGFLQQEGILVPPGETVYFVVGVDNTGGHPNIGTLEMEYNLVTMTEFDITDTQPPPIRGFGSFTSTPWSVGDGGLSDTIPAGGGTHTLDYSGFPNWGASIPSSYYGQFLSSCFDGTYWWIVDIWSYNYTMDHGGTPNDGDDSDIIYEYLGVWQLSAAGSLISFNVIDTWQNGMSHGPIGHDHGLAAFAVTGGGSKVVTDGSDVWIVIAIQQPQTNLYDPTIPPHDWSSVSAAVYSKSSGWSKIGHIQSQTHNGGFGAGGSGSPANGDYYGFLGFDCCASPKQPGVLHVVQSEMGGRSGDATYPIPSGGPYTTYGLGGYIWATTYATFGGSSRTSQQVLFSTLDTSATNQYPKFQNSASPFIFVRNDHDGTPIFCWVVPLTGGTGPASAGAGGSSNFEIYQLPGMTLLGTINAAFASGAGITTTYYGGLTNHSTPTITMSVNAFNDVGFDNKFMYLLFLSCSGTHTLVAARLPTDTWVARYIADVGAHSALNSTAFSGINRAVLCSGDVEGLWAYIPSSSAYHFIYCAMTTRFEHYGYTPQFPSLNGSTSGIGQSLGILTGNLYKQIFNFYDTLAPQFNFGVWLAQSHIWRDVTVCSINPSDCVSLCNGPIWFYVGGQWRQAGVDPDWNVYVFRNGAWHPVCTDPNYDAYVQLQGAWVPG